MYNIFNNAEQPRAQITLSTGEKVDLTSSAYTKYRSTSNRDDRKLIFSSLFDNYSKFQNTMGADLTGKLKIDFVYAEIENIVHLWMLLSVVLMYPFLSMKTLCSKFTKPSYTI